MSGEQLDDRWLDGWMGRGRAPGASGTVQVVVSGLTAGDGSWQIKIDDGVIAGVAPGAPPNADLTLTLPLAVAGEVASGSLSASAAFMQGRMKTAGDLGLVLDLLAAVDARS